MSHSLSQRPWLRRSIYVGAFLFLLLSIPLAYAVRHHASGFTELRRVEGLHAKEGRGSTIEDLLASIPDSNPQRHEQWWQWQQSCARKGKQIEIFQALWESDDVRKWRLGLSPTPPETLVIAFADISALAPAVEALLEDGPFIAGMGGSFKASARPDDPDWLLAVSHLLDGYKDYPEPDAVLHRLDFMTCRFLPALLNYRALTAESQVSCARALHQLDRLVDALSHPVGLSETLIWFTVIGKRDESYLSAMIHQHLPEEDYRAWLSDDRAVDLLKETCGSIASERLLRFGSLARLVHLGRLRHWQNGWGHYPAWLRERPWLITWWDGAEAVAINLEAMADVERLIERGATHPFLVYQWLDRFRDNPFASRIFVGISEPGLCAGETEFFIRRARAVALIFQHANTGGSLPADIGELRTLLGERAGWLDGGQNRLAMSYVKLSDERFRIDIDVLRITDGYFTPLSRYREAIPSTRRKSSTTQSQQRSGEPPPRTDLPPPIHRSRKGAEYWLPTMLRPTPH